MKIFLIPVQKNDVKASGFLKLGVRPLKESTLSLHRFSSSGTFRAVFSGTRADFSNRSIAKARSGPGPKIYATIGSIHGRLIRRERKVDLLNLS